MKCVLDAFARLRNEPELLRHSAGARSIDGAKICAPLLRCLEEQKKHSAVVPASVPRLDPKPVWLAWERANYDLEVLDRLQLRTLCTSEEMALRPQLIAALRERPEYLNSTLCLYGLVGVYFAQWRSMGKPYETEELIREALRRYHRQNRVVENWRDNQILFSSEAANFLADHLVRQKIGVEALEQFSVGSGTKLALLARAAAAEKASQAFDLTDTQIAETALRKLKWFTERLLPPPLPSDAFANATSRLILSKAAENFDEFRSGLRSYVLSDKRLGDPRYINNAPMWRAIAPQAQQAFLSWLARDSILFFFNTILPDSSENRRRKDFWLQFHRSILDFQVAVSDSDYLRIRASQDTSALPISSRVKDVATSAFLLEFAGYATSYVIVEFSQTGNAAQIYEKAAFCSAGVTFRSVQFDVKKHLKTNKRMDRIVHSGAWEYPARRKLIELGIRP